MIGRKKIYFLYTTFVLLKFFLVNVLPIQKIVKSCDGVLRLRWKTFGKRVTQLVSS